MRDQLREIAPSLALAPAARSGATNNGLGIDRQLGEALTFILAIGVVTDGTHTFKLQESSDNATFTDVAASDQLGVFTSATSGGGGTAVQAVAYIGSLRYVRIVQLIASGTTGAVTSAVAFLGYLRYAPSGSTIV
jgi:hypothetical protein